MWCRVFFRVCVSMCRRAARPSSVSALGRRSFVPNSIHAPNVSCGWLYVLAVADIFISIVVNAISFAMEIKLRFLLCACGDQSPSAKLIVIIATDGHPINAHVRTPRTLLFMWFNGTVLDAILFDTLGYRSIVRVFVGRISSSLGSMHLLRHRSLRTAINNNSNRCRNKM